jgi:hypothetical protein
MRRSLESLARCAALHGSLARVTWQVAGRELTLSPVSSDVAPVLMGDSPRDLGALVARQAIEHLGGAVAVDGDALRVFL